MDRAAAWCYTLNNYTEEEKENLWKEGTYQIQGYEKGSNGTPHIQGYIEFKNAKRLSTLKKINPRIHWEIRRGNQKAAIQYCKKEGDWKEAGQKKNQGRRSDISTAIQVSSRRGLRALYEDLTCSPNFQTVRSVEKYLSLKERSRNWKTEVYWIHGESGSGKSKLAAELGGSEAYWKDDTKWWDGYDQHQNIIWDDFRGHICHLTYLLKVLDRYPLRIETKGGYRQFLGEKLLITP